MNQSTLLKLSTLTLAGSLFFGCGDSTSSNEDNDNTSAGVQDTLYTDVLANFAGKVVVPTLADMDAKAEKLHKLTTSLQENPSDEGVKKVAQAWVDLRVPWEASEAFLFGPVAFLGLDPSLDSWPLDKTQLDGVLESDHTLDADAIELLGFSVRGFHTAEYLIFENGKVLPADSLSERELEYLVAITGILSSNSADLHTAWKTGEYEGGTGTSYQSEFENAGKQGSRYQSQKAAFDEIIEGMLGIIDEVATGKVGDPASENDPTLVESQFSWNSLTDFQNNMRSVQNAYLGYYHLAEEKEEAGLTLWVQARDKDLDQELRLKMKESIETLAKIPTPFRDHLDDENIDKAVAKMQSLAESISKIKDLE